MAARNLALIELGIKAAPFFAELRHHLPGWRCAYYSRREVVRSVLRRSGAELFPASLALPSPMRIDAETLRRAIGDKALVAGSSAELARAPRLLADLAAFLERERIDAVFVWNGSGLTAALAVHLARSRGLPVIFGENGYLPGTLQLDPAGVNYHASVTEAVHEGRAWLPPQTELDAELDRALADFRQGRTPPMKPVPRWLRPAWHARLRREAARLMEDRSWRWPVRLPATDFPARLRELRPRFVLLPFQVCQDSQLILHSPVVGGDMRYLLRAVHSALREVAPDVGLVVKLHPAERSRVLASYRDLPRQYPDVRFTLRHPMHDLLARCAAVVTVNSTAGFEGIVFDRPVVTLGRNFYTAPGLVLPVRRIEDLHSALHDALKLAPDRDRRRGFLRYVYARFLTHGSYRDFSDASFRAVAARMVELVDKHEIPA